MRVAYGRTEIEKLDIYQTKRQGAPIHIFIHGGAWRGGAAKDYAFPAEMFVTAGVHYIVPDFVAVQNAGGDLMVMADQVRHAIAWVYNNAVNFGGDPRRIQLAGHSSGAHLAGAALVTDWKKIFGLPADVVRAALLISGIYDLRPVRLSARSSYVKLDDASEDALSTQRRIAMLQTPLVVAYGTNETPEFQRQSRDFAAAVKAAGKPVQLLVGDNYNHFEMMETLANPYALAGRAALAQLRTLRT
jgi:arylformamidase